MKLFFTSRSAFIRVLLLSSGFWLGGCGEENLGASDSVDSDAKAAATEQEPPSASEQVVADETAGKSPAKDSLATEDQIDEIRSEIETARQNIENLEAFAEMERAKVEENPDYDQSFLLEALEEQQEIRDAIESDEDRLRKLAGPDG